MDAFWAIWYAVFAVSHGGCAFIEFSEGHKIRGGLIIILIILVGVLLF